MPGFLIADCNTVVWSGDVGNGKFMQDKMQCNKYYIRRLTLNKFMKDKVLYQDDTVCLLTEGVILNRLELERTTGCFLQALYHMWQESSESYFNAFRGSFSGASYDKHKDEWIIYTNHAGDKAVFYCTVEGVVLAGSDVGAMLRILREKGIACTFNEQAAYNMLTYGFMPDSMTYAKEIMRLGPGEYLKISKGELSVKTYHRYSRNSLDLSGKSRNEIISELDDLFCRAVRLEYEKDCEGNYEHLTNLSGGLDSRMNTWIAHELGYTHVSNISFGQSNCEDEIITKQIAGQLQHACYLHTLDDMQFLYEIDAIVKQNFGLGIYSGITGGRRMLNMINMNRFGIEHTGQGGDVIVGTFMRYEDELTDMSLGGCYSLFLADKVDRHLLQRYKNKEEYLIDTRLFRGALSTHMIRSHYTEPISPFLDVELLTYCLSIPIDMRVGHKLYKEWIIQKHPGAAAFKWEKEDDYVTTSKWRHLIKQLAKYGPNKILRILGLMPGNEIVKGMNPFDKWYKADVSLREYWDKYKQTHMYSSRLSSQLRDDMEHMYEKGNATDKMLVLTVLAAETYYQCFSSN